MLKLDVPVPDTRPLLVYFHGAPGGISEAQVVRPHAERHGLELLCQERFAIAAGVAGERYVQALADDVVRAAQGRRVAVVGFSIGAFVALQVSQRIPALVQTLHLVAPAAPLEGGDFLPSMAARQVFTLAQRWPRVFALLSHGQSLLAARSPGLLYQMLFASAAAADQALVAEGAFAAHMCTVLGESFGSNTAGYLRDVRAYVQPWHTSLQQVTQAVELWHGTDDNWSPLAMSTYLQETLPHCTALHALPGLSHYSALYAAAPRICAALAESVQV